MGNEHSREKLEEHFTSNYRDNGDAQLPLEIANGKRALACFTGEREDTIADLSSATVKNWTVPCICSNL